MFRTRFILAQIVLLGLLAGLYFGVVQSGETVPDPEATEYIDQPVFPDLQIDQIQQIELSRGGETVVLQRGNTGQNQEGINIEQGGSSYRRGQLGPEINPSWVAGNYHGYPVKHTYEGGENEQEHPVDGKILRPLRQLQMGRLQTERRENLADFGLDEDNATRVMFRDREQELINGIVLGERDRGFREVNNQMPATSEEQNEEQRIQQFFYLPEEAGHSFEVRLGESEIPELSPDPQEWIHQGIFSFDKNRIDTILLQDHEDERIAVLYRNRQNQEENGGSENNEDPEWGSWNMMTGDYFRSVDSVMAWQQVTQGLEEEENVSQYRADNLLTRLSDLSADQLEPPLTISPQNERPGEEQIAEYGFDNFTASIYLGRRQETSRGIQAVGFLDQLRMKAVFPEDDGNRGNDSQNNQQAEGEEGPQPDRVYAIRTLESGDLTRILEGEETVLPVFRLSQENYTKLSDPQEWIEDQDASGPGSGGGRMPPGVRPGNGEDSDQENE